MIYINTMKQIIPLLLLSLFTLTSCHSERAALKPQTSISAIDLKRYEGLWYEIARFDVFFQKNCVGVTAEYTKIAADKISVVNTCHLHKLDGEIKQVRGTARLPDLAFPAQLKVRFDSFPANLFEGDYWVIALDKNYQWAVVSEKTGSYLWILSRTKTMPEKTYDNIIESLKAKGLRTDLLIKTAQ